MAMPDVVVKGRTGGTFKAYMSRPSAPPPGIKQMPGLVLIQEIFGVNEVMRNLADDYARQGYIVLCPDLFWRKKPGIQLTDKTQQEWDIAFALYRGFDEAKGVEHLGSTMDELRRTPGCSGKVGAVGYCLGGKLAYLMSTRTTIDCSVGFYGVGIDASLTEASKIRKPLMLHVAEDDQFVPHDVQDKIVAALGKQPQITLHKYANVNHAFAREGGKHFNADAARVANKRTTDFLVKNLYI
jgi:carboxymethylenebutenolidase